MYMKRTLYITRILTNYMLLTSTCGGCHRDPCQRQGGGGGGDLLHHCLDRGRWNHFRLEMNVSFKEIGVIKGNRRKTILRTLFAGVMNVETDIGFFFGGRGKMKCRLSSIYSLNFTYTRKENYNLQVVSLQTIWFTPLSLSKQCSCLVLHTAAGLKVIASGTKDEITDTAVRTRLNSRLTHHGGL